MPTQCYASTGRMRMLVLTAMILACATGALAQAQSGRRLTAHVVAIDQPFMLNRLGAAQPAGMIFALQRDIVPAKSGTPIAAGNAQLRAGKRPRPIVLRMNVGDTLTVYFKNYLTPYNTADSSSKLYPYGLPISQGQLVSGSLTMPATRWAGVHAMGMEMGKTILDDGSGVGANPTSLVPPGGSAISASAPAPALALASAFASTSTPNCT